MAESLVDERPGPGHNDEDWQRRQFVQWYSEELEIEARIKAAQEQRKKLRQTMKAEGVTLANYDAFKRLMRLDADEQTQFFGDIRAWAAYMRAPIGEQLSLSLAPVDDDNDESREAAILAKARHEGFLAGAAGKWEDECPHEANSPAGQEWLGAYREAQEEAASSLGRAEAAKAGKGGKKGGGRKKVIHGEQSIQPPDEIDDPDD